MVLHRAAVALCVVAVSGLGLACSGSAASAQTYTVSPTGDDGGPGTAEAPWRTISHAARTVGPGSTVDIRAGVYAERVDVRVSGTAKRPISFRAHPGERPVIDGASLPAGDGLSGLIHVDSRHHVSFEGLELRGYADPEREFVPAGVVVTGSAHHVTLRGLDVHDIATAGGDAHGIAVYGTSARRAVHAIRIDRNAVHDLTLGSSESVVVNGNVRDWSITRNHVYANDNIGIDAIGFEKTASRDDRARDGVIADNLVEDIDTEGNPAYAEGDGGNCRCAGGIYVDGGTRIRIERNTVLRSNLGIELASEHANGSTSDVLVRDNVVRASTSAGLAMGGYDRKRGPTVRARVLDNTFEGNDTRDTGDGQLLLQYRVSRSVIRGNVFGAGAAGTLMANPYRENAGNRVDGNVWWVADDGARASASWEWRGRTYEDFDAYRRATGNDRRGRFTAPALTERGLRGSGAVAGARRARRG